MTDNRPTKEKCVLSCKREIIRHLRIVCSEFEGLIDVMEKDDKLISFEQFFDAVDSKMPPLTDPFGRYVFMGMMLRIEAYGCANMFIKQLINDYKKYTLTDEYITDRKETFDKVKNNLLTHITPTVES